MLHLMSSHLMASSCANVAIDVARPLLSVLLSHIMRQLDAPCGSAPSINVTSNTLPLHDDEEYLRPRVAVATKGWVVIREPSHDPPHRPHHTVQSM